MSNNSACTPVARDSLQIESARLQLFKAIEDLRVLTDELAQRLAPIRDMNNASVKDTEKTVFPPVCSHAIELLDATHRISLIHDVLNGVSRDLQI